MSADYFYDLLKAGKTPDDITKMLNAAQQKIRKEKAEAKKNAEKDAAIERRADEFADAAIKFYIELGILDADADKELRRTHELIVDELMSLVKPMKKTTSNVNKKTFETDLSDLSALLHELFND